MLELTEKAIEKIKGHLESHPEKKLRVFIEGGGEGCGSGYRFGMALDSVQENDHVLHLNGLDVLIDPESLPFTEALVVDYAERDGQDAFEIFMPNAQGCDETGCSGCSSSGNGCGDS